LRFDRPTDLRVIETKAEDAEWTLPDQMGLPDIFATARARWCGNAGNHYGEGRPGAYEPHGACTRHDETLDGSGMSIQ